MATFHLGFLSLTSSLPPLVLSLRPQNLFRSYGMRFIAKVLKDSLHEKFPDASEDELLKVRSRIRGSF